MSPSIGAWAFGEADDCLCWLARKEIRDVPGMFRLDIDELDAVFLSHWVRFFPDLDTERARREHDGVTPLSTVLMITLPHLWQ